MKKSLFFYAAAALALTACTSENDILQTGPEKKAAPQEVGFDVYTPAATDVTRGGYEGVMSTTRLQSVANGFGVFSYYTDQTDATTQAYPHTTGTGTTNDYIPNFMWNENVKWNNTSKGWEYAPLKYWPNETGNDSQTNPTSAVMDGTNTLIDKLTFFAYAPFVDPSVSLGTSGIRAITANTGVLTAVGSNAGARTKGDPAVEYKTAASVVDGVDLLWGVAPAGGLHYTAVNGNSSGANEGLPYIDLVKPDVNTSLKFNFQHALARFGFTVAAAIDQVPQGGSLASETRITVDKVELSGYFSNEGILNLNNYNHPGVANWIEMNGNNLGAGSSLGIGALAKRTITITTDIADQIEDSRTNASQSTKTGVTTAKQDLLMANYSQVDKPTKFVVGDKYYNSDGSSELYANITGDYYILDGSNYKKVTNSKGYPAAAYYTIEEGSAITADVTGTHDPIYKKNGNDYNLVCAANVNFTYNSSFDYCYLTATNATTSVTTEKFTWPAGDYYKPERSFLMVIPTNNVPNICTTNFATDAQKEALRTIWVKITYYVTTDDINLSAGFSRVKNVIEKKVVLPSLDNGKSYNLHLLLGLTSVKVEAEVGDWKEVYVQTDLPQNTPGE